MGFPKALAPIADERRRGCARELALERVLRLAREESLPALVVLGFHAARIARAVDLESVRVVVNPAPERGQSSSVRVAARAVLGGSGRIRGALARGRGAAALCLLPVDHARVAAATFAKLVKAFRSRRAGIELVVPSHGGRRGHPLLASPRAVRELAALADDEPAHVVVRRDPRRVQHVVVDDPFVLADFDRPSDLAPPRVARARSATKARSGASR
jgi:CTP:molybdopterin cytidylyltransferase MocA